MSGKFSILKEANQQTAYRIISCIKLRCQGIPSFGFIPVVVMLPLQNHVPYYLYLTRTYVFSGRLISKCQCDSLIPLVSFFKTSGKKIDIQFFSFSLLLFTNQSLVNLLLTNNWLISGIHGLRVGLTLQTSFSAGNLSDMASTDKIDQGKMAKIMLI